MSARMHARSIAAVAIAALATTAALSPASAATQSAPAPAPHAALAAAVADESRPEQDRARDGDRRPAEVLAFFGIEPGSTVGEVMSGAGYYTEILARAIGPDGKLYAHNSPFVLNRYAEKPFTARLARLEGAGVANVERIDAEPETLGFPEGALDAVVLIRFYHDFYWQEVDRAAFNRAVFRALKPGGVFGVVDHHAEAGSGSAHNQTLHRIDAELVKREITAAGFVVDAESDVLANPEDDRSWNIFVDRGAKRDRTDRFVIRFRKPSASDD